MERESNFGGFHCFLIKKIECEGSNLKKDGSFLVSFNEFDTINGGFFDCVFNVKSIKGIIVCHGAEAVNDRASFFEIASITEEDVSCIWVRIEEVFYFVIVFVSAFNCIPHGLFFETFIASQVICPLFFGFSG